MTHETLQLTGIGTSTGCSLLLNAAAAGEGLRHLSIPDTEAPADAVPIGNIRCHCGDGNIHYSIVQNESERSLGERPPFPLLAFGLEEVRLEDATLTASTIISDAAGYLPAAGFDGSPSPVDRPSDEKRAAVVEALSNHVMGIIGQFLDERVVRKGLFAMPFFIRYCWRIYDGSRLGHSVPVLMAPALHAPEVGFQGTYSGSDLELTSSLSLRACRLTMQIRQLDMKALDSWLPLVESLEIYISAPILPHDPSGKVYGYWTPALQDSEYDGAWKALGSSLYAHHLRAEGRADSGRLAWKVPENSFFSHEIANCSAFYLAAEIPVEQLTGWLEKTELEPLPLKEPELTSLRQWSLMPDDFLSRASRSCNAALAYNSRLHVAGIHVTPAPPVPLAAATPYVDMDHTTELEIGVLLRKEGKVCRALLADEEDRLDLQNLPQYLFYPDADAFALYIMYGQRCLRFPLRRHDFLNGAFYSRLWHGDPVENSELLWIQDSEDSVTGYSLPSTVAVSEPSNPFLFSAKAHLRAGNCEITSLQVSRRELSQGQFGQWPIYAFSTGGIHALSIAADGTIAAARQFSDLVAKSPASIAHSDQGLFFLAKEGLMLLDGAKVVSLSEGIDRMAREQESLPGLQSVLQRFSAHPDVFGAIRPDCWSPVPAGTPADASLILDEKRENLFILSPGYLLHWAFHIPSRQWSLVTELDSPVIWLSKALDIGRKGHLREVRLRPAVGRQDCITLVWCSDDQRSWLLRAAAKGHRIAMAGGSPFRYYRFAVVAPPDGIRHPLHALGITH